MAAASILVTGGAGYIGSHCVRRLLEESFRPVVVDNLCSGRRGSIPAGVPFAQCDAGDAHAVGAAIREHGVSAVMHFAGHIVAPESVADPLPYYSNNVCVSRNLVETCLREGVRNFIFSSSAAVYGNAETSPVPESAPLLPISPYGTTKLITEWMLRDVAASRAGAQFRYVALRYFNVAGARLDGTAGQETPNATHLIKVAAEAACGRRKGVSIFGTDYPTRDGTCIRDYIHVEDLADAHISALRHLQAGGDSGTYNCGYGRGYTVREVLSAMQEATGIRLDLAEAPRRPGDPANLVADSSRILRELRWLPRLDDLKVICESAYRWERSLQGARP
jgi:UDP-glucose 4-epimerase